jgi:hypothetical protein
MPKPRLPPGLPPPCLKRYQEEIEQEFGEVLFLAEPLISGQTQRYAMLTEDQSYVYLAYSKNTEQARACKRMLVKAFSEAKRQLAKQQPSRQPRFNNKWEERKILFHSKTKIPLGYWCVFEMVASFCEGDEYRNTILVEQATPDISVGLKWCQHLREQGYDMARIQKYDHVYPDKRGVQPANIYPNEWLGEYWTWFRAEYLNKNYPAYLKNRTIQPLSIAGPDDRALY